VAYARQRRPASVPLQSRSRKAEGILSSPSLIAQPSHQHVLRAARRVLAYSRLLAPAPLSAATHLSRARARQNRTAGMEVVCTLRMAGKGWLRSEYLGQATAAATTRVSQTALAAWRWAEARLLFIRPLACLFSTLRSLPLRATPMWRALRVNYRAA